MTASGWDVFLLGDENIWELADTVAGVVNMPKLYRFELFKQLILVCESYLNKKKYRKKREVVCSHPTEMES